MAAANTRWSGRPIRLKRHAVYTLPANLFRSTWQVSISADYFRRFWVARGSTCTAWKRAKLFLFAQWTHRNKAQPVPRIAYRYTLIAPTINYYQYARHPLKRNIKEIRGHGTRFVFIKWLNWARASLVVRERKYDAYRWKQWRVFVGRNLFTFVFTDYYARCDSTVKGIPRAEIREIFSTGFRFREGDEF